MLGRFCGSDGGGWTETGFMANVAAVVVVVAVVSDGKAPWCCCWPTTGCGAVDGGGCWAAGAEGAAAADAAAEEGAELRSKGLDEVGVAGLFGWLEGEGSLASLVRFFLRLRNPRLGI
jgi:hypothetical protein